MSLNFQKYEKLKAWNSVVSHNAIHSDAYNSFDDDYYSPTGLTASDIKSRVKNLNSCCDTIEITVDKKGTEYVQKANFCRAHCVCPICASRVQSVRRKRYLQHIQQAAQAYKNAYMVTFTMQGQESLAGMIDELIKSVRRWRKMGQLRSIKNGRKIRSKGEAAKVQAGLVSYEVKRGKKSNLWHVHAHALFFTDIPFDYRLNFDTVQFNGKTHNVSKIQKEWFLATNGKGLNINVQKMQQAPKRCSEKKRKRYDKMSFSESIAEQSKEILKYNSKLNPSKSSDIIEIMIHTHYRRLFAAYGAFYGLGKNDYEIELPDRVSRYFAVWSDKEGRYKKIRAANINEYPAIDPPLRVAYKLAGVELGAYRRRRRSILNAGGKKTAFLLDQEKKEFRKRIVSIWQEYYLNCYNDRKNLKTIGAQQAADI